MPEKTITENPIEAIICSNCKAPNPLTNKWCEPCGCSLWEEQPQNENEIQNICSWEIHGAAFIGRRKNNEDAYVIKTTQLYHDIKSETIYLLAIADGMGGYENGEEASRTAVTTLSRHFSKDPYFFRSSIKVANLKIYLDALKKSSESGATIIAALINDADVHIFWAGDSPLYHIRNNKVVYRTEDHNVANELISQGMSPEEANTHPDKSLLTRSLGANEKIELSEAKLEAQIGDYLLLCSDGISSFLTDEEIYQIIQENPDVRNACNSLLRKALDNGSTDNLTAIVAKYGKE